MGNTGYAGVILIVKFSMKSVSNRGILISNRSTTNHNRSKWSNTSADCFNYICGCPRILYAHPRKLSKLRSLSDKIKLMVISTGLIELKRCKPDTGWFKGNVDGASKGNPSKAGYQVYHLWCKWSVSFWFLCSYLLLLYHCRRALPCHLWPWICLRFRV
jgi:hypothetical protein